MVDLDPDLSVQVGDLCLDTALGEEDFDGETELEDFSFFTGDGDGEQECGDCFLLCPSMTVGLVCIKLLIHSGPGLLSCVWNDSVSDLEELSSDLLAGT